MSKEDLHSEKKWEIKFYLGVLHHATSQDTTLQRVTNVSKSDKGYFHSALTWNVLFLTRLKAACGKERVNAISQMARTVKATL